jgi:hypothetical protein
MRNYSESTFSLFRGNPIRSAQRERRGSLLLILLWRTALLAGLAILLGLNAALVIALFAGGFRLVAARNIGANDGHAAKQGDGAED